MSDLRLAIRTLARQPTFSLAVIATLALAMGVSTGLFGVVNALMLRPLPGVDAPGLISLHVTRNRALQGASGFSGPTFSDYRERVRTLAGLEAFVGRGFAIGEAPSASVVDGQLVSGGFFHLLGTRALRGRLLSEADDSPGAVPALVMSEPLWRHRFAAREDVVGKTVRVSGRTLYPRRDHRAGLPWALRGLPDGPVRAVGRGVSRCARLGASGSGRRQPGAPGPSSPRHEPATLQAELDLVAADLGRALPAHEHDLGVAVSAYTGLDADLRGPVLGFVAVLSVVGTLVLLVACLDVAGLVLARAAARDREMAVRATLGAARSDLVRPMVVETLLLFATGGLLGAALAKPAAAAFQAFLPDFPVPLQLELAPDLRVALFAAALPLLTGLVFGIVPAVSISRVDALTALKQGGRGVVPGRHRARRAFLAVQVALSLVLLVGAGLFLRELQRARAVSPGFRVEGVGLLTVDVRLANRSPAAGRAFFEDWQGRIRTRPGVESACIARTAPLGFGAPTTHVVAEGLDLPKADGFPAAWNAVSPGYFDTLGIPLFSGRDFNARDAEAVDAVAIISQSTAARLFPRQEPLGRTLRRDGQALRVVGVVGDIAVGRSGARDGLFIYVPFAQTPVTRASLLVRTSGQLPFIDARAIAAELDPDLPVLSAMTLSQHAGGALFPQRLAAAVSGAFGLFGVLLASVGLYGLVSYVLEQRRHELAIRAALGARPDQLRKLVFLQGLRPVAAGVVLGLAGALVFGRLASAFVPAVGSFDGTAFAGAALVLTAAASLAASLPASRAATAAPAEVLRSE